MELLLDEEKTFNLDSCDQFLYYMHTLCDQDVVDNLFSICDLYLWLNK